MFILEYLQCILKCRHCSINSALSLLLRAQEAPKSDDRRWDGQTSFHELPQLTTTKLLYHCLKNSLGQHSHEFFTNTTEMEANTRVLLLVLDAVSQCDDVMINLQPSVVATQSLLIFVS